MNHSTSVAPSALFTEKTVEADGFEIRYLEAGSGDPLVYIHGASGVRLSKAHDILAESYRIIAFEVPGFGDSPANETSQNLGELAATLCNAVANLGIDSYNLMGMSFGGKVTLSMGIHDKDKIKSLVLLAPAAIRLTDSPPPAGGLAAMKAALHAHPDDHPDLPAYGEGVLEKQHALVGRVMGPPRDEAFETALGELEFPVLVCFGTEDKLMPPEVAHIYAELLPNCHLMMIYDAAHAVDADRPEAVAEVTGDFIERHEKFLVRQQSDMIHP
jgi:pimeloyl-ACP methyl ester carboxylesterase